MMLKLAFLQWQSLENNTHNVFNVFCFVMKHDQELSDSA